MLAEHAPTAQGRQDHRPDLLHRPVLKVRDVVADSVRGQLPQHQEVMIGVEPDPPRRPVRVRGTPRHGQPPVLLEETIYPNRIWGVDSDTPPVRTGRPLSFL